MFKALPENQSWRNVADLARTGKARRWVTHAQRAP